ncbi:MAG TPA: hypothetical protein VGP06_08315 [Janthinobacterium sp.]|nr:hypothetical protein [Janthinobacterium sp.]
MNVLKNMEIIFIVVLALACSAVYVGTLPEAQADARSAVTAAGDMPVVVISAKRMSAEEKQQSLNEERAQATTQTARSTI